MILIIASVIDDFARTLASEWPNGDARVVSPKDLSLPGWRCSFNDSSKSQVNVAGDIFPVRNISGVLTLLPWVSEQELLHIDAADRSYVAAEMQAFLVYWLSRLTCPVFNRATPQCLSGVGWRREQWIYAAARLGIPVRPLNREIRFSNCTERDVSIIEKFCHVTVAGVKVVGSSDQDVIERAQKLASFTGQEVLSLVFDERGVFVSVELCPDLTQPGIRAALHELFNPANNKKAL